MKGLYPLLQYLEHSLKIFQEFFTQRGKSQKNHTRLCVFGVLIGIWSGVVLKGVAFQQEEVLGEKKTVRIFFAAQTHSAVAVDTDGTLHLASE